MRSTIAALAVCLAVAAANLINDVAKENNIDIFLPKSSVKKEPFVDRGVRAFYYNYWLYPGMAFRHRGPYASSPYADFNYVEPLTFQDVFEKPVLVLTPSQTVENTFSTFYLHNGLRSLYRYRAFSRLQEFFKHPNLKGLIFYPQTIYNVRFFETPISSFTLQDDFRMSDFIGVENCNGKLPYMFVAPEDVFDRMHFENIAKVSDFKVYNDVIEVHPILAPSRPVYEPFYGSQSPQQPHAPPVQASESAANPTDFRSNEEDTELVDSSHYSANDRLIDSQVVPQADPFYAAGRNIAGTRGNVFSSGLINQNLAELVARDQVKYYVPPEDLENIYYQNQGPVPVISRGNIAFNDLQYGQENEQLIGGQSAQMSSQNQILRSESASEYGGFLKGNVGSQVRELVGHQGGAGSGFQAGSFSRVGSSGLVSEQQELGGHQTQSKGYSSTQSETLMRTEGQHGGQIATQTGTGVNRGLGTQTQVLSSGSSKVKSASLVRTEGLNGDQIGSSFGVQGGIRGSDVHDSQTQVTSSGFSGVESGTLVRSGGLNVGQIRGSLGIQGGVGGNVGLGTQTQTQSSGSSAVNSATYRSESSKFEGQNGGHIGVEGGVGANEGLGFGFSGNLEAGQQSGLLRNLVKGVVNTSTKVVGTGAGALHNVASDVVETSANVAKHSDDVLKTSSGVVETTGNILRTEGLHREQIGGSFGVLGGIHSNVGLSSQTEVQSSGSSRMESENLERAEGLHHEQIGGSFGVQREIHGNVAHDSHTQVASSGFSGVDSEKLVRKEGSSGGQTGGSFSIQGGIGGKLGLGSQTQLLSSGSSTMKSEIYRSESSNLEGQNGGHIGVEGGVGANVGLGFGISGNLEAVKPSGLFKNLVKSVVKTSTDVVRTGTGAVQNVAGGVLETSADVAEHVGDSLLKTSTGAVRGMGHLIKGSSDIPQSSLNVETSTFTGSQKLVSSGRSLIADETTQPIPI